MIQSDKNRFRRCESFPTNIMFVGASVSFIQTNGTIVLKYVFFKNHALHETTCI